MAIISNAFPVTIFLNIVVIKTGKQKIEMQNKSNILLASLAVADLLVGHAISMPLSITADALVLCKIFNILFVE